MNKQIDPSGFYELSHTADMALFVWAADLPTLFIQAAKGMNAMMEIEPAAENPVPRSLYIPRQNKDTEDVLVAFLSELIFLMDVDRTTFSEIGIIWSEDSVLANLEMVSILTQKRVIKAVTFHNIAIKFEAPCYQVTIVFDV